LQELDPAELECRLRLLAQGSLDWTVVVRIALQHRVVSHLYKKLISLPYPILPKDIQDAMGFYDEQKRSRNQLLIDELHIICGKLKQEGIRTISYKGPAVAMQAYGDPLLRICNDLDLIINRPDFSATIDVLQSLGYANEVWKNPVTSVYSWLYYGQDILFHREKNIAVEPHWLIAPSPFCIDIDFEPLWERAVLVEINGREVTTLSPEDHLIFTTIHGCKEQWMNLRQVTDTAALIRRNSESNWELVCARADDMQCLRMLLVGLGLAHELLDVALPCHIDLLLKSDRTSRAIIRDIAAGFFYTASELPDIRKVSRLQLKLRNSAGEKLAYTLKTLLMPSDRHFRMLALPRALFFLYYPLKVVHDYLYLPTWLAIKRLSQRLYGQVQI
jgi:hypothetical protein